MVLVPYTETPVRVLERFGRLVAGVAEAQEIMPLLLDAVVRHVRVDAAAVLRVSGDVARVFAARNLPEALRDWEVDSEPIDSGLSQVLVRASAGHFQQAHTLPLVAGGDLYGVLVLFLLTPGEISADRLELAGALADLGAMRFAKAEQYEALVSSYEELRASRASLLRTEKLRALGQMAAGVAHDLKNILNPLGIQLALFERRVGKDPEGALKVVRDMRAAIQSGIETIQGLTAFSRQEPEVIDAHMDINAAAATALGLSRPRIGTRRDITIVEELGEPPPVRGRVSDLVNAIVNLVLNALEAMAERGGTITVRSGAADGGGWIEVEDDGPGMPPDVESRIYEPFFTTKSEGTGLGLPMVYAFVQRHGGQVTLTTASGAGARFRLWFPG